MSSQRPEIQYLANIHIAKRLKEIRSILGIYQTEIGNEIGVTSQQFQRYENAINRISAGTLFHLAQVVDVDLNWFVQGFESPKVKKLEYRLRIPKDPRQLATEAKAILDHFADSGFK